jgi:outer membrane protein assembly factor BamE (lipoprotein component of BamABCDE complex)
LRRRLQEIAIMIPRHGRTALIGTAIALLVMTGGCARVRDHQGYVMDPTLVSAIRPGVDNRDSVAGTLGRPTFVGQFSQNDWYYVSRETRQQAFAMPRPVEETVLHVSFDPQGNVAAVERTGLEKVVRITPMADKTPTLGRERSFFEELFSNVGVSQMGGAAGGANGP